MDSRELPVHGNSEHLCDQMCPEQVGDGLVVVEVSRADPDLSQQPVVLTVGRKEDRVVFARSLAELTKTQWMKERQEKEMLPSWCNTTSLSLYLYGDGQDLVPSSLVEQTDGSCQVLQSARVCGVRTDAV